MSSVLPELSSVATALEELLRRVTTLAEGLEGEALTNELQEVERTMGAARRRLRRLLDNHPS
jgi:ABC-type transporter Mla subunit MlaD